jgi:hypothetical protein
MKSSNLPTPEQVFENVKAYKMNRPQMLMRLVRANETYAIAGRGAGKTSGGIAPYVIDMVNSMPQSSGAIIGLSYEHLEANTMPPLLKALADMGYQEGIDYVYSKRPPANWPKPFIPVLDYEHCMIWKDGTAVQMVSLARKASSNALSIQWGVFDEFKFMDVRQLEDEIFPIFRGNEQHFKHQSEYLSKFFASDKKPGKGAPYSHIKHILDKRKLNDWQLINTVITIQISLNSDIELYYKSGEKKQAELRKVIRQKKNILNELRKDMVFYCEFSSLENINNLGGEKWLRDKLRNSKSDYDFRITYLNDDPERPEVVFYPDWDDQVHEYSDMQDIEHNTPFIITADYQHSIAPIPVSQISTRNGKAPKGLWTNDEVYTLAPEGLSDAVQKFCDRYKHHGKKLVYYPYDHTATGKRVEADEYYKIVEKTLRKNGWAVKSIYTGDTPSHYIKYEEIKNILKSTKEGKPMPVGINKQRCIYLAGSIKEAAAKIKEGKTFKDKNPESDANMDQRTTTHFSDTYDQLLWAVKVLRVVKMQTTGTGGIGTR